MIDFLHIFKITKLKLLKKEIESKEKLCEAQARLNTLIAEEKMIDSLPKTKKIKKVEEVAPQSVEYLDSL